MPDETASVPRSSAQPPPLIFEWGRVRGLRRRLAMWVLLVAAGHAALFYLFRVAAPLDSRKPPPPQSVIFLPPKEAGVRSLLSALNDRYPGAVLRSEDYNLQAEFAALAKATPPSEPSWATHRAALKPFPQPLVPQELPGLIQPGDPLLPEPEPPAAAPATAPEPAVAAIHSPSVIIDDPAAGRPVVRPAVWPETLFDDTWPEGGVPFMLGVDRQGRPEFCLPLSPATRVDLESIRRQLMQMRFTPVSGGGLQWITVVVLW